MLRGNSLGVCGFIEIISCYVLEFFHGWAFHLHEECLEWLWLKHVVSVMVCMSVESVLVCDLVAITVEFCELFESFVFGYDS